jgi:hypothetical protein
MIILRHIRSGILCLTIMATGIVVSPVSAQDSAERSLALQGGPYIASTTGNRANMEFGLRVGMRSGVWRWDLTGSAIPISPHAGCDPSACSRTVHVDVLGGVSRSLGRSPDAPSIGFRVGVGAEESLYGPPLTFAGGPHVSVGIPIHAAVGLRTEAGARAYMAPRHMPGARAYISFGVEGRR